MVKNSVTSDPKTHDNVRKAVLKSENPLWDGTISDWIPNPEENIIFDNGILKLAIRIPVPERNAVFVKELRAMLNTALSEFEGIRDVQVTCESDITSSAKVLRGKNIEKVKNIIAVASNKGGVGKSTVTVNLAAALKHIGAQVAILDLDVYGPSLPVMFDLQPSVPESANRIVPIEKYGIQLMSMGMLIPDEQTPLVFRAPVADKIVTQFFENVLWREVDYLLVDLPPGTGDIQLSLAQQLPHARMIMVTVSTEASISDVQKGIRMFTQEGLNLDILGIVENMAYFVCDQCNKKSYIFDQRGAKVIADGFGLEILGNIPLVTDLRVSGDEGIPIVIKNPNHAVSKSFIDMAELVSARIAQRNHEQAKKKEKVVINLDMAT